MTKELRCDSKKHAELDDEGHLIVKCSSRFCGAGAGVIVLHVFSREGDLVKTSRYKEIGASNVS